MSLYNVHLHKLLAIMYATPQQKRSILMQDIRRAQTAFLATSGGDFYAPFWADVKAHVAGSGDLSQMSQARIENNFRRERLYEQLKDGFLEWWTAWRRWQNEPIKLVEPGICGKLEFGVLGATVKVKNLLSMALGGSASSNFAVYPYFREEPELDGEAWRLAVWAVSKAVGAQVNNSFCILDIQRGVAREYAQERLRGDEEDIFTERYADALLAWADLGGAGPDQ